MQRSDHFWRSAARSGDITVVPHVPGGVYTNYLDRDYAGPVGAAYSKNDDRLVELKHKYDPQNLSWMNQHVSPSTDGKTTTRG